MDEPASRDELQARPTSPCTRVCTLDEQNVCLGCLRTLAEIVGWSRMTADEQRALIKDLAARRG